MLSIVATFTTLAQANQAATHHAVQNIYSKAKEDDETANLEIFMIKDVYKYVITLKSFRYHVMVHVNDLDPVVHEINRQPLRLS